MCLPTVKRLSTPQSALRTYPDRSERPKAPEMPQAAGRVPSRRKKGKWQWGWRRRRQTGEETSSPVIHVSFPPLLSLRPTQYNGAQPPRHFQEEIMGHHSGAQAGTCKIWGVSAWEGFTEREPRSKGVYPRNPWWFSRTSQIWSGLCTKTLVLKAEMCLLLATWPRSSIHYQSK